MTIQEFSLVPDSDNMTQAQYDAAWNTTLAEMKQFALDFKAGVLAMSLSDLNSTSADSVSMALVQKTITVDTGKSYMPGHLIMVARTSDPTYNMPSLVISYNSGTGQLVFLPQELNGAGTFSGWSISFNGATPAMADNEIILTGNNGIGSTNTAIQRYVTVQKDTSDSWMTYTSSSTLGDYITIDKTGDYEIYRYGAMTTSSAYMGASLNSGGLTTSFVTRMNSNPEEFILGFGSTTTTLAQSTSRTMRLEAGDVIRAHNHNSSADSGNGFTPVLAVKRLGFI
ncbi:hypothetical protein SAMN05216302_101431 [Nitrosomonas aestuarii]|uniref:Uncharacterized protein n=1 Tax=Nitrosomonas aestuarii TaxID=52441 RepID=A0A1I4BZT3_9PROT|nr:hypothetical protein [Nitrosomonas aestuarii]SFK74312.1 hypothetical protein SAMN05216302_101431 [Nitrosomonas aestuarii]